MISETPVSADASVSGGSGIPPPPDQTTPTRSGTTPPRPARFPDPDGYRLEQELGSGGMGVVFSAVQLALHRSVAVKFLRADGFVRPDLLARFRTEAAALARTPHPNIVQVFEVGEAGGTPFLVLELVAGGSLADKLQAGPLAPRAAAEMTRTLAAAVQAAHAAGIVHRDLKPANVLLTPDGTPKVTDFGLAKPFADAAGNSPLETWATVTGQILGTPSYMAPEQASGLPGVVGPAADVYALGVLLYECLTGRVPFKAASVIETLNLVVTADPPPPRQLQPGLPKDIETVCLKCLRKTPAERYASAQELADDLGRFLAGEPIRARPIGALGRAAKWCRRNPTAAVLVAVGAVAVAAAVAGVVVHNTRLQAALDAKTVEEQKARAEKERADENYKAARDAVRTMLDRVGDKRYAGVPRVQELYKAQAAAALAYFRTVAAQRDDPSPQVRYDAAWADFESANLHASLGEYGPAADQLRRALDGFDRLAAEFPENAEYRRQRANVRAHLASQTAGPDGIHMLAEATADLKVLAADPAASYPVRLTLANVQATYGAALIANKRYAEAEPELLAAYRLRQQLNEGRAADRDTTLDLAKTYANLSTLYRMTARSQPAEGYNDRCEELLQRLTDADPNDRGAVVLLASQRVNWAYVLEARDRRAEAIDRLTKTLVGLERHIRLEPNDAGVRDMLFRTYGMRGKLFGELGRHADSVRDNETMLKYAATPAVRRYYGWFLARSRLLAGDVAGTVRDLEALDRELGMPTTYGEPQHGAETAADAATRFRVAVAVGSAGPAAALDRAEALAVRLLGKMKSAAGPVEWSKFGIQMLLEPRYVPLTRRDDFHAIMNTK